MEFICHYVTPLGPILLASDGEALTGLWFEGQKYCARTLDPDHRVQNLPVFREACRWLDCYFSRREPDFRIPLRPAGTPFQQEVWEILTAIPYGQTMTYRQIAAKLAANRGLKTMSAQAVGGAVGRNPISILIPCHRVVGTSGSLTGYAGGLERKAALLELEQT